MPSCAKNFWLRHKYNNILHAAKSLITLNPKLHQHRLTNNRVKAIKKRACFKRSVQIVKNQCLTRFPYNLRPTTRECVHLVTRGHFRSRDKDVGPHIRSAIHKPLYYTQISCVCVENRSYWWSKFCSGIFFIFLLPWPWPWPDDLHIWTWPVFSGDKPEVQIRTSYVKAFKSFRLTYKQTYIQTDRNDRNYSPRRFGCGQKRPDIEMNNFVWPVYYVATPGQITVILHMP